VAVLARHFVARFAAEENKPVSGLTPEAAEMLEKYDWPGNVRQLENTVFRAVVLCDETALDICDFPQIASAMGIEPSARRTMTAAPRHDTSARGTQMPLSSSPYMLMGVDAGGHMRKLEDIESEVIRMAISRYDGHMSEVARRLGIGRSTLYRKLKDLGLESSENETAPENDSETPPQRAAG
jgi:DNA-binding NtrC family response regulator